MGRSNLQEPFLRDLVASFKATEARIVRRLRDEARSDTAGGAGVIEDELRGLYHGLLVILDGGSALAEEGLLSVVDEDGVAFDRNLHEIGFRYWPQE